ncbi:MAG: FAD-binding and (Fe-S)-binding domain-containing protein [Acidobacteriota bacterium]
MPWSEDLAAALGRRIRGEVRDDAMSRALYSTDASIYRAMPLAAVVPYQPDDLRATVEFAAENDLPLLPRGGGTSLEGQTVNEAVVVDCSPRLNRVLEVNVEEQWARVQPGVVQDGLSQFVAEHGLKLGPDTATGNRATLGGMMGNNSAGSHSIVYGKTIDHVLEMRCLLADGTEVFLGELDDVQLQAKQRLDGTEGRIYRTVAAVIERHKDQIRARYPKIMRHVCGYSLDYFLNGKPFNMANLIVGSEGTLATILEAKVRLVRRPRATALGVAQFGDLVSSMEAAREIVATGPSAVELIDSLVVEQARNHPQLSRFCGFVEGSPEAVLITEYSGEEPEEVADRVEQLRLRLQRLGLGYGFHAATSPAAQADIWQVRKSGLTLMLSLKGDAKPIAFVEDTAVEVDRLPEYVQRLQQVVAAHDTWAGFYGHASVGCLHFRPSINCKKGEDIRKLRGIAEDIRDLVMEFGGSLSGEHGDGRTRTEYLPHFYGEVLYDAFRQIKTAFDPEGRLNPGNICDPFDRREAKQQGLEEASGAGDPLPHSPHRIDRDLRYGTDYRTHRLDRFLDWSREGGMDKAIEMCNGNGHCRKTDAGTMCPSYMVTQDEQHSTRGRANALRSVISGALPLEAFTSRRLYEILDLCLECKGCRGECPSNVDMAKLKYEFLAQYYEAHGTPVRARLFGHVAQSSKWGSRLAPLSNWLGNSGPGRWLNQRLFGIARQRPLPPFARQTFEAWFERHRQRSRPAPPAAGPGTAGAEESLTSVGVAAGWRGPVVLFHDTFMNYNYPDIGIAAVRVLEAAGYQVMLADKVCCGRPMLSNGLAEEARQQARINVERLARYASKGIPIVGCEPSCLLMLREDYRDLLPADPAAEQVASQVFLIEEFLTRAASQASHGNGKERSARARGAAAKAGETAVTPLGLRFRPTPRQLLVHGHCHQKAVVGMEPTLALLGWVPGYRPTLVDSGCCGMAGSFGYKAEHYDTSMAIGERVLFSTLRQRPDDGVVVSGISCRQQVLHGSGRKARHPVEWLAEALLEK